MPCFAEKGGFEPPVQLPVRQFSKLLVSATHPSLLVRPNRRAETAIRCLNRKAGAKVLLFFDIRKFYRIFFA